MVTAEDGGTRTYTINVVRKEAVNPEPSPELRTMEAIVAMEAIVETLKAMGLRQDF